MPFVDDSEIAICNDALALIGHPEIHDFEGSTPASEVAARLFALVLGRLMGSYPWRFAMKQVQLAQVKTDTVNWDYAHALPIKRSGVPRRYYSDRHGSVIGDWEIYSGNVLTDCETVFCDYLEVEAYTGPFRDLFVRALASDFALSLCDDRGIHDRLKQDAFGTPREGGRGGLFKSAISTDAAGAGPRQAFTIGRGPLVDAHNGYSGRRRDDVGSW